MNVDLSRTLYVLLSHLADPLPALSRPPYNTSEVVTFTWYTSCYMLSLRQVMQAVGSCMTNKYSEGLPGARYYGGNEHIDKMERLCQVRSHAQSCS